MNCLVMFAKYPEMGKVKTRLSKDIGEEKAVAVYSKILSKLVSTHKGQNYDFKIAFSPDSKEGSFKEMFSVDLILQSSGNIGDRMRAVFYSMLDKYDKVVVIGSDTPNISSSDIEEAFLRLDNADAVVGPAVDGGYYLIGMKEFTDFFSGITWSTSSVFEDTTELIVEFHQKYELLEEKRDIDTADDLKEYPDLMNL